MTVSKDYKNLGVKESLPQKERINHMNEFKLFQNPEFGELSVIVMDGKEYFPATKCAKALGYQDPQKAIRTHCKGVEELATPTGGGTQTVKYIPEGDLYRLIIRSNLPAAERFETFVFDEILPNIRKSNMPPLINIEEIITKTATAVVSALIKELPLHKLEAQRLPTNEVWEATPKRRVRRSRSIISCLSEGIRTEVENMIASEQYSYADIQNFLNDLGVRISLTSICRYANYMDALR